MLSAYFSILIFLGVAFAVGLALRLIGPLLAPYRPDREKNSSYECGFEPITATRLPFDVRFYLVAILFILFDVETAFLIPWGLVVRHLNASGFFAMLFFLLILTVGFIYEWWRGALEWE